jgi:ketosteroid isomerase-like protein
MKLNVFMPLILLLMLSLVMNISNSQADDLEEFKAAVESYNNAYVQGDIDKRVEIESESVGLSSFNKNLVNLKLIDKELRKKQFNGWISQYEYYDVNFVTLQTDVIGNTGIASGTFNTKRKHKEYPEVTAKRRWSSTWLKTNDQWKLIFFHRELIDTHP